jgi:GH24 family phage-related lysozyme (muramidase)
MKLTQNPIKSSDENICGASFAYRGTPTKIESASGVQPLTFSPFTNQSRGSTVTGVFVLGPDVGTANIQLDAKTSVVFTVAETYQGATLINALVSITVFQDGALVLIKQYPLKDNDSKGEYVDTKEPGIYTAGGFSINMPTKMGGVYSAKVANKSLNNYHCNIDITPSHSGECLIKSSTKLDFALEDKFAGFTTGEKNIILPALTEYEKKKDFMYVDSTGNVTTGIGFKLATESAAASYPFLTLDDDPATDEQKRAEWRLINSHYSSTGNHTADWYEDFTTLYLADEFIDNKLVEIVGQSFTDLSARISGYGEFPSPVRIALQDIAYNVGAKGLVTKFPRLMTAINLRDWATAAQESHRSDPDDERNNYVRDLFLSAVHH